MLSRVVNRFRLFFCRGKGRSFANAWYKNFDAYTRKQTKNFKTIPIIINNFNQLKNLVLLIDFLKRKGYNNIYILDNNSTYPPLLKFYQDTDVTVFRTGKNFGHLAFWKNDDIYNRFKNGYHIVTDPDVIPSENCPDNFVADFINVLNHHPEVLKVGCALKITDIPDTFPLKQKVLTWEQQFWQYQIEPNVYLADIDTTFAVYRPHSRNYVNDLVFYNGIRLAGNYTATHGGWYLNPKDPTEEEAYYMRTAQSSSSWIPDADMQMRESAEKYFQQHDPA